MSGSDYIPANSPEPSPDEAVVNRFLDLLDKYGHEHVEVANFLQQHPELREWGEIVKEMENEGRKKQRRSVLVGVLFSGGLVATVVLVLMGVYRVISLSMVESERDFARLELSKSAEQVARLPKVEAERDSARIELSKAQDQVNELRTELTNVRLEKTKATEQVAQLEEKIKEKDAELALYRDAKASIAMIAKARDEALAAKKKAEDSLASVRLERDKLDRQLAVLDKEKKELKSNFDALVKDRDQVAAMAKKFQQSLTTANSEVASLRKQVDSVSSQKKTLMEELAKASATALALSKDVEKALKDLTASREALKNQKKDYEEQLRNSPYFQAMLVERCSMYRNVTTPKEYSLPAKLLPAKDAAAPGFRYALAIGHDLQKREADYRGDLETVIRHGKDWSKLASAELRGLSLDPIPLVDYLLQVEAQLANPPKDAPLLMLLMQKDVGQQAALRVQHRTDGKARILYKLMDVAKTGKTPEVVAAISALGTFGYDAKEAVPQLASMLRDRNRPAVVYWEAATALGKIGPAAESAVPALLDLKFLRNPAVDDAAQTALHRIVGAKGRTEAFPAKGKE